MNFLWYLAALSFVGFLASLWFRDRERRTMCRTADPFMRESPARDEWVATYDKVFHSTAQMRRVAILRKNANILPAVLRDHLRRYILVRWIPVFFLLLMLVAGLISNGAGGS